MAEHITRGQIVRTVQLIAHRHPAMLRKEWLYGQLKPIVEALELDLKEAGYLKAQKEEQPAAEASARPETPDKTDLGDNPKKPVEEKGRKNKGNEPKEKKK